MPAASNLARSRARRAGRAAASASFHLIRSAAVGGDPKSDGLGRSVAGPWVQVQSAGAVSGADYLVIGRPITASPDPRAAVERLLEEMAD